MRKPFFRDRVGTGEKRAMPYIRFISELKYITFPLFARIKGLTCAEVPAELDRTPKAAKSLLYRARNQLRTLLDPFVR